MPPSERPLRLWKEPPPKLRDKRVVCLDIPDRYELMAPELVALLTDAIVRDPATGSVSNAPTAPGESEVRVVAGGRRGGRERLGAAAAEEDRDASGRGGPGR